MLNAPELEDRPESAMPQHIESLQNINIVFVFINIKRLVS